MFASGCERASQTTPEGDPDDSELRKQNEEAAALNAPIREAVGSDPEHWEAIPARENIRRGAGTKLTADDVREIKESGDTHAELGQRFGVSPSHVSRIKAGLTWRDV